MKTMLAATAETPNERADREDHRHDEGRRSAPRMTIRMPLGGIRAEEAGEHEHGREHADRSAERGDSRARRAVAASWWKTFRYRRLV